MVGDQDFDLVSLHLVTKGAAIASALFYLLMSTGIHLHIDKCCDTVENVLMVALATDCCKEDAAEMAACEENSCGDHKACPTEQIDIQLDDIFLANSPTTADIQLVGEIIDTPAAPSSLDHSGGGSSIADNGPPLAQPIYILHSSLVYYG